MSTVTEIEAALHQLSPEELARVEKAIHHQYRKRGGMIYVDSHGAETDANPIASADEEFQAYVKAEVEHLKRQMR